MPIGEICNREVVIVKPTDSVIDAARLMRHNHVGSVVVVEKKEHLCVPIGILTDRDIVVELVADDIPAATMTVQDVMSLDLVVAREGEEVWDTIARMHNRGIRRIVVVNDQGGLVGIVSVDDLLDFICEELAEIVRLSRTEQVREKEKRK